MEYKKLGRSGTKVSSLCFGTMTFGDASDEAMSKQLKIVVQDGAEAIVMGSTTMALQDEVVAAAQGVPLLLPGMVGLRALEFLWREGMLTF